MKKWFLLVAMIAGASLLASEHSQEIQSMQFKPKFHSLHKLQFDNEEQEFEQELHINYSPTKPIKLSSLIKEIRRPHPTSDLQDPNPEDMNAYEYAQIGRYEY